MTEQNMMTVTAGQKTESLIATFHRVQSLIPDNQKILTVSPETTVAEALQLMREKRFSQLPVTAGDAVLGVFSYRSFSSKVAARHRLSTENLGDLPVEDFLEDIDESAVNKRPSISLSTLNDEAVLEQFLGVLQWFVDEIVRPQEELPDRHARRHEFWRTLLEKARERTPLHSSIGPSNENWISAGAGARELGFNYVIRMDDARIELYIDGGDAAQNRRIFEVLERNRAEIESRFSGPLDWLPLEDKRACKVQYEIKDAGGLRDREKWPALQDALIDAMIRFSEAFQPAIKSLRE